MRDFFGREIAKYTVIYGVHIRFWPTLHILQATLHPSRLVCICAAQNLGYSRQASVSSDPHDARVMSRVGNNGAASQRWSQKMKISASVPWESKLPKLFFRGTMYCPYIPVVSALIL